MAPGLAGAAEPVFCCPFRRLKDGSHLCERPLAFPEGKHLFVLGRKEVKGSLQEEGDFDPIVGLLLIVIFRVQALQRLPGNECPAPKQIERMTPWRCGTARQKRGSSV